MEEARLQRRPAGGGPGQAGRGGAGGGADQRRRPTRDHGHERAQQCAQVGGQAGGEQWRIRNPMTALAAPEIIELAGRAQGAAAGVAVRIDNVSKTYGSGSGRLLAVDRVSIDVHSGEFVCLVGASGCGKSTMLSMIAGLDKPTAGSISVTEGRPALMFQEPALLPWLTVQDNVELPLKLQKVDRVARRERVAELLELVHQEAFAGKRP